MIFARNFYKELITNIHNAVSMQFAVFLIKQSFDYNAGGVHMYMALGNILKHFFQFDPKLLGAHQHLPLNVEKH